MSEPGSSFDNFTNLKVRVTGLPPTAKTEDVLSHFESLPDTAGIRSITFPDQDSNQSIAVVTFRDEKDAQTACRQKAVICGKRVKVEALKIEVFEYVTASLRKNTKDNIVDCDTLEEIEENIGVEIKFEKGRHVFVGNFEQISALRDLLIKKTYMYTFNNTKDKSSGPSSRSSCYDSFSESGNNKLKVIGLPKNASSNDVISNFETVSSTSGVQSVTFPETDELHSLAIVTFENEQDCKKACKQSWVICGKKVDVEALRFEVLECVSAALKKKTAESVVDYQTLGDLEENIGVAIKFKKGRHVFEGTFEQIIEVRNLLIQKMYTFTFHTNETRSLYDESSTESKKPRKISTGSLQMSVHSSMPSLEGGSSPSTHSPRSPSANPEQSRIIGTSNLTRDTNTSHHNKSGQQSHNTTDVSPPFSSFGTLTINDEDMERKEDNISHRMEIDENTLSGQTDIPVNANQGHLSPESWVNVPSDFGNEKILGPQHVDIEPQNIDLGPQNVEVTETPDAIKENDAPDAEENIAQSNTKTDDVPDVLKTFDPASIHESVNEPLRIFDPSLIPDENDPLTALKTFDPSSINESVNEPLRIFDPSSIPDENDPPAVLKTFDPSSISASVNAPLESFNPSSTKHDNDVPDVLKTFDPSSIEESIFSPEIEILDDNEPLDKGSQDNAHNLSVSNNSHVSDRSVSPVPPISPTPPLPTTAEATGGGNMYEDILTASRTEQGDVGAKQDVTQEEIVVDCDMWDYIVRVHGDKIVDITTKYNAILETIDLSDVYTIMIKPTVDVMTGDLKKALGLLTSLYNEVYQQSFIEVCRVPRKIADSLIEQTARELQAMYHNVLVKLKNPHEVCFVGEASLAKSARSDFQEDVGMIPNRSLKKSQLSQSGHGNDNMSQSSRRSTHSENRSSGYQTHKPAQSSTGYPPKRSSTFQLDEDDTFDQARNQRLTMEQMGFSSRNTRDFDEEEVYDDESGDGDGQPVQGAVGGLDQKQNNKQPQTDEDGNEEPVLIMQSRYSRIGVQSEADPLESFMTPYNKGNEGPVENVTPQFENDDANLQSENQLLNISNTKEDIEAVNPNDNDDCDSLKSYDSGSHVKVQETDEPPAILKTFDPSSIEDGDNNVTDLKVFDPTLITDDDNDVLKTFDPASIPDENDPPAVLKTFDPSSISASVNAPLESFNPSSTKHDNDVPDVLKTFDPSLIEESVNEQRSDPSANPDPDSRRFKSFDPSLDVDSSSKHLKTFDPSLDVDSNSKQLETFDPSLDVDYSSKQLKTFDPSLDVDTSSKHLKTFDPSRDVDTSSKHLNTFDPSRDVDTSSKHLKTFYPSRDVDISSKHLKTFDPSRDVDTSSKYLNTFDPSRNVDTSSKHLKTFDPSRDVDTSSKHLQTFDLSRDIDSSGKHLNTFDPASIPDTDCRHLQTFDPSQIDGNGPPASLKSFDPANIKDSVQIAKSMNPTTVHVLGSKKLEIFDPSAFENSHPVNCIDNGSSNLKSSDTHQHLEYINSSLKPFDPSQNNENSFEAPIPGKLKPFDPSEFDRTKIDLKTFDPSNFQDPAVSGVRPKNSGPELQLDENIDNVPRNESDVLEEFDPEKHLASIGDSLQTFDPSEFCNDSPPNDSALDVLSKASAKSALKTFDPEKHLNNNDNTDTIHPETTSDIMNESTNNENLQPFDPKTVDISKSSGKEHHATRIYFNETGENGSGDNVQQQGPRVTHVEYKLKPSKSPVRGNVVSNENSHGTVEMDRTVMSTIFQSKDPDIVQFKKAYCDNLVSNVQHQNLATDGEEREPVKGTAPATNINNVPADGLSVKTESQNSIESVKSKVKTNQCQVDTSDTSFELPLNLDVKDDKVNNLEAFDPDNIRSSPHELNQSNELTPYKENMDEARRSISDNVVFTQGHVDDDTTNASMGSVESYHPTKDSLEKFDPNNVDSSPVAQNNTAKNAAVNHDESGVYGEQQFNAESNNGDFSTPIASFSRASHPSSNVVNDIMNTTNIEIEQSLVSNENNFAKSRSSPEKSRPSMAMSRASPRRPLSLKPVQPEGGSIDVIEDQHLKVPGYPDCGSISVNFCFPPGEQKDSKTGTKERYRGLMTNCYLPNNTQGQQVRRMMERAFKERVLFKVSNEISTKYLDLEIVWNDVTHKPDLEGPDGYPDTQYLDRVTAELVQLGLELED